MELNQCISFLESRIEATNKIIEHLNQAKKTKMATDLVYQELEMQYGERDLFYSILEHLKTKK